MRFYGWTNTDHGGQWVRRTAWSTISLELFFMFPTYKSVQRRVISLVFDKKTWKKYKNIDVIALFCQKKCAGGKTRQHCSSGRSQKGTAHTRYKNVPSKSYTDITIFSLWNTFSLFLNIFFKNIFYIHAV